MSRTPIRYWDRVAKELRSEKVYGDAAVRWLYETRIGGWVAHWLLSQRWISKITGFLQSTAWSRRRIPGFVENFEIPMEEFEEVRYGSFNDFFCRRFRPQVRPFVESATAFPAFAEGRYLAFEAWSPQQTFPVKGKDLAANALLGAAADEFVGGPVLIARLCPTDYHRFHFPDAGSVIRSYRVGGRLHSVNPLALRARSDIFVTNERRVTILETANFGKLAYVEVGAMSVGKIVQTHTGGPFARGDEKGYFLFGGSTVIVLGEPGAWQPDADLLEKSSIMVETLVRVGERVARAQTV
ncbi:MAG: phosphatidylserine decarboxylase [Planctomycetota bacterium]